MKELSFLKRRLAAGCDNKTEVRQLETLLIQLFDQQLQGLKIRSRVKWIEEGETPSKYFSRLENEQHAKVFVSSVFDSSGVEVSSLPAMMEAHETFYSDLFSFENIDLPSQEDLFSHILARLSESERTSYKGPLKGM